LNWLEIVVWKILKPISDYRSRLRLD